ncbi:hypothetical protein ACFL6U_20485 [Planctomycetota bacterium]
MHIIATANRNLEAEVEGRSFRPELYEHLTANSLALPSLWERQEDILLLAQHYCDHYAKQLGKEITTIAEETEEFLTTYAWPGNIHELRHVIHEAVLASEGPELQVPDWLAAEDEQEVKEEEMEAEAAEAFALPTILDEFKSLADIQRDYIIHVLRKKESKLEGKGGAADILELKPSTLRNRMKKLGISREDIQSPK